ncbi:MAG: sterol desaturase family protein [Spirulinaceae cyanobacterium]
MPILKALIVAIIGLLGVDFFSTFLWHVPQHIFGKMHLSVHHAKNKGFRHYAVLTSDPAVLIDSALGVSPIIIMAPILWPISPSGVILGYILGQCHCIWRHSTPAGWKTPAPILEIAQRLCIITPEFHWQHHENVNKAFGDIFTFFDAPARAWLKFLATLKHQHFTKTQA